MSDAAPVLLYWERLPPAEIVAAASIAKVAIEPRPDPKANGKDYVVSLKFSDGYEYLRIICAPDRECLLTCTVGSRCKSSKAINTYIYDLLAVCMVSELYI